MEDKNKIKKQLDKAQKESSEDKVVDLPHKGLENEEDKDIKGGAKYNPR